MSPYVPTNWQKRIIEFPDRYTLTDLGGGLFTIAPSPGTVIQAGTPLTEDALNNLETQYDEAYAPVIIRKTADEVVNNSDVLQNDDHLLLALAANEERLIQFVLFVTAAGTTSDFKVAITVPAGADVMYGFNLPQWNPGDTAGVSQAATASGQALTLGTSNAIEPVVLWCWVLNGANVGNLQLQWAQNTANATNTGLKKGSCLIAHKLS